MTDYKTAYEDARKEFRAYRELAEARIAEKDAMQADLMSAWEAAGEVAKKQVRVAGELRKECNALREELARQKLIADRNVQGVAK